MRNRIVLALQSALAAVVVFFVGRTLVNHWSEFRSLDVNLTLRVGPIGLSALTVWVTFAILIAAWRLVIVGWRESLRYDAALRIWCLSNMGRYLPGKVWSIAGLAVLAQRAGVTGWAASGSAVAMQALAVGTGASAVAISVPHAVSPAQLIAAVAIAAAVVWLLVSGDLLSRAVRVARPNADIKPLSPWSAMLAAAAALASWITYGVAFWFLARGLFPEAPLSVRTAIGVFAAGYILGLLAIFVPGGLGVREAVFVAILAPRVGGGTALALAVGSRLLMTSCEIVAALVALLLGAKEKGEEG